MEMKFSHGIINCEKSRLMECWFNEILSGAIFSGEVLMKAFLFPHLAEAFLGESARVGMLVKVSSSLRQRNVWSEM